MNPLRLILAYLMHRPLLTALNVLLLAIGIASIVVMLLFAHQADERLRRDARGVDLVIGAKGSPMQLILSTIYHLDVPTGNIRLADVETLLADPMVKRAIPLALGDSYRSFRIVGTSPDLLELQNAKVAQGSMWKAPLEVVLGSEVARQTGMVPGSSFAGSHGLGGGGTAHGDQPFTVSGVMAPTDSVLDRLILTSVESVWKVHESHGPAPDLAKLLKGVLARDPTQAQKAPDGPTAKDEHEHDHAGHAHGEKGAKDSKEVTAYLVQYASPLATAVMPRMVNATGALMSASPAYETARLLSLLGFGLDTLRIFALVLVAASGLGIFIALTQALEERRADLALLRVLGASPGRLFVQTLGEGVALTLAGVILGLILGHLATHVLGAWLMATRQVAISGAIWLPQEWGLVGGALLLGVLAALIPALRTWRQDVAPLLQRG